MYSAEKTVESSTAKKIPEPSGYKLLIKPLEVKEKTDSGIYMPDALKNAEQTASVIGFVVKAGPDAYMDTEKFPNGPYCKEGFSALIPAHGLRWINRSSVLSMTTPLRLLSMTQGDTQEHE